MDFAKLDAYLAERYPGQKFPGIHNDGLGNITIEKWPEGLGKAPTEEEIDAWTPTPPDPDKVPAPSLEVGDYKALDAALEAASTVAQVKAVFRQYLRRRAGL